MLKEAKQLQQEAVEDKETIENSVLADWEEYQNLPIQKYFKAGWKPRVKKDKGQQYIIIKTQFKEDGKRRFKEKSLGRYEPGRWQALLEVYPRDDIFPETRSPKRSPKLLSSKLAKPKPLGSTVHITITTLYWYNWLRENTGYNKSLDAFINEAVNGYFTEHHKLELAVIHGQGGD